MKEEPPNPFLKALGRRIRELRTERGYSQEAFADKCGVHRTFMGTIERGESNLSFQNVHKVATTLGISLSALFKDIEQAAQAEAEDTATLKPKFRMTKTESKSAQ
jgi:transcriptional regulator with XRE-family HTH domain